MNRINWLNVAVWTPLLFIAFIVSCVVLAVVVQLGTTALAMALDYADRYPLALAAVAVVLAAGIVVKGWRELE